MFYSCTCSLQFSSVTQLCLTLCDPMDCSMPGFPVHHQLLELTQTHVHSVRDAIQPTHPRQPLPFPPSIFPSIRVFSNESVLRIRLPKYWSFSLSISPSNEYSVDQFSSVQSLSCVRLFASPWTAARSLFCGFC